MITPELIVKIRNLFFAEHWTIGTIASQLGLHRDTVRAALETEGFNRARREHANRLTDPYLDFIRQTLKQYPRLRATRIFQMVRTRGYEGSVSQLRRIVADIRPATAEAFLQLRAFLGRKVRPTGLTLERSRLGAHTGSCHVL